MLREQLFIVLAALLALALLAVIGLISWDSFQFWSALLLVLVTIGAFNPGPKRQEKEPPPMNYMHALGNDTLLQMYRDLQPYKYPSGDTRIWAAMQAIETEMKRRLFKRETTKP